MNGRGLFDFGVIEARLRVARFFRRGYCLLDDDSGRFRMDFADFGRAPGLPAALPALT